MLPIRKKTTPEVLLEKQKIAKERGLNSVDAYALLDHDAKTIILESLMSEQGHLCAYCMRRLPDERVYNLKKKDGTQLEDTDDFHPVTIEHWLPRSTSPEKERGQGLDYNNMLAVCSGNRGCRGTRRTRDLTCDAKRAKNHPQLTLNPVDFDTLKYIQYKEDGTMYSENPDVDDDITVKLNLNCISGTVQLPTSRKKVLEALQEDVYSYPEEERAAFCEAVLRMYEDQTDPKSEYSGILIWWLHDYLSNANTTY